MAPTYESISNAYKTLGYPFKPFNVFGIRSEDYAANAFNDLVGWIDNKGNYACYEATTDPGVRKDGIAIMKAGFYPGLYKMGTHKNNPKHPCLQQVGKALFYRIKGGKLFDPTTLISTNIGANIHSTREDFTPERVDNFSLACQVIRRWQTHLRFLVICRQSGTKVFDYALFQEKEV
jgi:hypothetical protein